MGAWGTEPFENDSAADFLGVLKRVPKVKRLEHVRAALQSYLAFDADPNRFAPRKINLREVAKAFQTAVQHSVAQAGTHGSPVQAQVAKFVGKSADELVAMLPIQDPIYDGGHEALTAIAAAELLLARVGKATTERGVIASAPTPSVRRLLPLAKRSIEAILKNGRLRDSWNEGPRGPWRKRVQQTRAALELAMTANSALQRTRKKQRAVDRGR